MTESEKQQLINDLNQFHGTEHYYRYLGIILTDGVKFLCESAKCWWYADIIASMQFENKVKKEPFQVFKLNVNPDQTARVTIEDGNDNIIFYQDIQYTDFPLDKFVVWCIDKIALLPSEY
ncbi:MAG: DUF6876 family protein [FCB group bacterium]|jgi:hypothetical protein